jgi:DNA-binding MarR family transcriptional regulator
MSNWFAKEGRRKGPGTTSVVAQVCEFNRFYTRRIGVLRPDFLGSEFSLTEVRILYELANRRRTIASELVAGLGLDPGYVSRLLKSFEAKGLVERRRMENDGRTRLVTLTAAGRRCFSDLDARQVRDIEAMVRGLGHEERRRLIAAMSAIRDILLEAQKVIVRRWRAGAHDERATVREGKEGARYPS